MRGVMFYYRCRLCQWTTEIENKPACCARCLAQDLQHLNLAGFTRLLEAHEIAYCGSCQSVHTR